MLSLCAAALLPARQAHALRGPLLVSAPAASCSAGTLAATVRLPAGFHLTKGVQSVWTLSDTEGVTVSQKSGVVLPGEDGRSAVFILHFACATAGATLRVSCRVYYCQEESTCLQATVVFTQPFSAEAVSSVCDDAAVIGLAALVPPPSRLAAADLAEL